ncbi:MAG: response regulator [Proteobacteria bacterium]|nr:response regulator [Pseudomonadota bacterium]MBU1687937.1 response regulator [Pseudomonadota bacterium]
MQTLSAEKNIKLRTTAVALSVALFMALLLPTLFFFFSFNHISIVTRIEAEMTAERISKVVSRNPNMWMFLEDRIYDQLTLRPLTKDEEVQYIVYDLNSDLVFASDKIISGPKTSKSSNIYNAGIPVGRVTVSRSTRPLILESLLAFCLSSLLGLLIFFFLRNIPLKALEQSIALLVAEKERLRVTLENIGEGVLTTDSSGRILLCNQEFMDIVELSRAEAAQYSFEELVAELLKLAQRVERRVHLIKRVMQSTGATEIFRSTEIMTKNGNRKTISCLGAPLKREDEHAGAVFVVKDITEQIQIQQKINKVEQLEALGIVAGGIAHDFNNFLATILINISNIRMMTPPTDQSYQLLANSEESIIRAQDLTQQLITFSRGGELQRQTEDVAVLIKRETDFMLSGSNIQIHYQIHKDLWVVDIDPVQFCQVIQNLVINANQAMPGGGVLNIRANNITLNEKHGSSHLPPGNYIEISFEDTGIGISPEKLQNIFTPFYTDKKGGTGLGLAVSHSVINRHQGDLSVSSIPGKGSTFTILLPAEPGKEVPKTAEYSMKEPMLPPTAGEGKILLMDDNEDLVKALTPALTNKGYQVVHAPDGLAALDLYQKSRTEGVPFDLVILDLTVPGGLGGKKTMEKLREIDPEVKALVSSGYSKDPVMANYEEYGFKGAIRKPFRIVVLTELIKKTLSERAAESAG